MGLGQAKSSSVKLTHKEMQCDPFYIHLFYLVIVKTDPAQPFLFLSALIMSQSHLISGFPPSQPIRPEGAWPNKIKGFSLPWVQHLQKMYELEKKEPQTFEKASGKPSQALLRWPTKKGSVIHFPSCDC